MEKRYSVTVLVFVSIVAGQGQAHAYLDPGAGSMILQLILGGIGGLVVLTKLYWHKVRHFFSRRAQEPESVQSSADDVDEPAVEKEKVPSS